MVSGSTQVGNIGFRENIMSYRLLSITVLALAGFFLAERPMRAGEITNYFNGRALSHLSLATGRVQVEFPSRGMTMDLNHKYFLVAPNGDVTGEILEVPYSLTETVTVNSTRNRHDDLVHCRGELRYRPERQSDYASGQSIQPNRKF